MHKVTLIKGDGIGSSIMDVVVKIIDASGVKVAWEEADAGMTAFGKQGTPIPDETLASIDTNRTAFKGPLTKPVGKGFRSINVALRQKYDLYADIRPARSWKGAQSKNLKLLILLSLERTRKGYTWGWNIF